jgi:hypothetical protein
MKNDIAFVFSLPLGKYWEATTFPPTFSSVVWGEISKRGIFKIGVKPHISTDTDAISSNLIIQYTDLLVV